MNNGRKNITFLIVGILIVLVLGFGITYSIFGGNFFSSINGINSGKISFTYTEPTNSYSIMNAFPLDDKSGMKSNNYFEFNVTTTAPTRVDDEIGVMIPYEISISPGSIDSGKTALTNDQIKVYLTEVINNEEKVVTPATLLSELGVSTYMNNAIKVGFDINVHDKAKGTISKTYRLRTWIDFEVDASDWDSTGEYQYKFNVNVNGESNYQGYSTPLECFTFSNNTSDSGFDDRYVITGYDSTKCTNPNLVIPDTFKVVNHIEGNYITSFEVAESEDFYNRYKQFLLSSDGECPGMSWEQCLVEMEITDQELRDELISEREDFESIKDEYLNRELDPDDDFLILFDKYGLIDIETEYKSEDEVLYYDVIGIKDITDFKGIGLTSVVLPKMVSLATSNIFEDNEILKFVDEDGNFPRECYVFTDLGNSNIGLGGFFCNGIESFTLPATYSFRTFDVSNDCRNRIVEMFNNENMLYKSYTKPSSQYYDMLMSMIDGWCSKMNEEPNYYMDIDGSGTAFDSEYLLNLLIKYGVLTQTGTVSLNITQAGSSTSFSSLKYLDLSKATYLRTITYFGFSGASNQFGGHLEEVLLPEGLETIEGYAFYENKLKNVVIPSTVTSIGDRTFASNGLETVNILSPSITRSDVERHLPFWNGYSNPDPAITYASENN